jgi:hypothetical protein
MPEQSDQPRPHGDPLEDVIDNDLEDTGDESQDDGKPARPDRHDPGTTHIADIEN